MEKTGDRPITLLSVIETTAERIPAAQRREQILAAALVDCAFDTKLAPVLDTKLAPVLDPALDPVLDPVTATAPAHA